MDEMEKEKEKERERARENERETLYMPHNSLKMSEAGGAQEIGPHTASACVCSPGPHPGPLDEHLERRTMCLVPESHRKVGSVGGESLTWDKDIAPMSSAVQTSLCCCCGYLEPVILDIFKYLKA